MSALYLVRHGQAAFGTDDYDRLTALGEEQCRALGSHWAALGRPLSGIYSGAMRRQRLSAEIFAAASSVPVSEKPTVTVVAGLEEYDHELLLEQYADASGDGPQPSLRPDRRVFHELLTRALRAWLDGGIPGPEPFTAFRERCEAALEEVIRSTGRGSSAVLFGSAGSLAVAIQRILGMGDWDLLRLKLNFYNSGVSKLLFNDRDRVIESINSIAHLERPATLRLITHR
jgi:broad specificity phosphatase PhoE